MDLKRFDFCKSVQSLLRYHRSAGIVEYVRNEEINRFVQIREALPAGCKSHGEGLGKRTMNRVREQTQPAAVNSHQADIKLFDLRDEISICTACDLAAGRLFPSAGRGSVQAKLFVVGEWLSLPDEGGEGSEIVFGVEEDLMLSRMIAAMGLQDSDTFITNSIKCGLGRPSTPTRKNFQACLPFLHRQINLVQPDVICAMGTIAAQMLLKTNRSLSQLRGRFHSYEEGGSGSIPLMPTYHPTYLLKNEEMKKVTWVDLQAIGRRLTKNK